MIYGTNKYFNNLETEDRSKQLFWITISQTSVSRLFLIYPNLYKLAINKTFSVSSSNL